MKHSRPIHFFILLCHISGVTSLSYQVGHALRLTLRMRLTLHMRPTFAPHICAPHLRPAFLRLLLMVYLQEVPGRWWADPVVFCFDCEW